MSSYLYAIRIKETKKFVTETGRVGKKKWYPAEKWAQDRIVKLEKFWPSKYNRNNLEIVKFELVEVDVIQPNADIAQ